MDIAVTHAQGSVPVVVLRPSGDLDASNYRTLIAKAQEVYNEGARNVLLDLSDVPYTRIRKAIHTAAAITRVRLRAAARSRRGRTFVGLGGDASYSPRSWQRSLVQLQVAQSPS